MKSLLVRGLLVLAVTLLVGAAAYAFSVRQAQEFQSSTRVQYGQLLSPELQLIGGNFGAQPDVDEEIRIETEAAQADSFDVARAVAKAIPQLGLSASAVAARVDAAPIRGSLVVAITATAPDAPTADRLATVYTREYIELLRDRERSRAKTVQAALETRLDDLSRGDRIGPIGAGLRNQVSSLRVLARVGSGSPQVIEEARSTGSASEPKTQRNVLFGLLFGLAVGIGLVALRSDAGSRALSGGPRDAYAVRRSEPARKR